MAPQAKKVVFGDDGEIAQEIVGFQPEEKVELKPTTKKNRVEKRQNLRKKLVKQEQEYFAKKYQNELEGDSKIVEVAEESTETPVEESTETPVEQTKEPETKESVARKVALEYLSTFISDKPNWKFQKVRQTWILRNLYYQHQIDNEQFKHCLKYMANMGDRAKKETIEEAKQMLESQEATDTIKKRAKKIVKAL